MWAVALVLSVASGSAPREELARLTAHRREALPNGLEVLLREDRRYPLIAVSVWYRVGAFSEAAGRSGFAHLFEHLMFEGSAHVPLGHAAQLARVGAVEMNGTTDEDRTAYFETVPSSALETALWLESDRMGFLVEALDEGVLAREKEVVKNERRERVDNAPYGAASEKMWRALFPPPHPYAGHVIGTEEDLDAANIEEARAFFRAHYSPSNATLCLAGDFDAEGALRLVRKYFETLPASPKHSRPRVVPAQLDRQVVIRHDETIATLPAVLVGWHSPALYQPGDEAADVLAHALSGSSAGRLQRRLREDGGLAETVAARQASAGFQSVFRIQAVTRPAVAPERLLESIDAELDRVRRGGVTTAEIARARAFYETALILQFDGPRSLSRIASLLQIYDHHLGRADGAVADLERYDRVTPEAVARFAAETLSSDRRVVVFALPRPGGER